MLDERFIEDCFSIWLFLTLRLARLMLSFRSIAIHHLEYQVPVA